MKELRVVNRKKEEFVVLIDDEDFECLKDRKFKVKKCRNNYYCCLYENKKWIYVHRYIMSKHIDINTKLIDHKDRNSLNNQKDNLRSSNHTENGANCNKYHKNPTSVYKGVSKIISGWCCRLKFRGKTICVGVFETERDAAIAYDIEAKKHFGEFAMKNIKDLTILEFENVCLLMQKKNLKKAR